MANGWFFGRLTGSAKVKGCNACAKEQGKGEIKSFPEKEFRRQEKLQQIHGEDDGNLEADPAESFSVKREPMLP